MGCQILNPYEKPVIQKALDQSNAVFEFGDDECFFIVCQIEIGKVGGRGCSHGCAHQLEESEISKSEEVFCVDDCERFTNESAKQGLILEVVFYGR